MSTGDSHWIEKAQSAEAQLNQLRGQIEPMKEKIRHIKESLCAKEKADGTFSIDFVKLVEKLGPEAAMELRAIVDERYGGGGSIPDVLASLAGKTVTIVSAEPGRKPKLRVHA